MHRPDLLNVTLLPVAWKIAETSTAQIHAWLGMQHHLAMMANAIESRSRISSVPANALAQDTSTAGSNLPCQLLYKVSLQLGHIRKVLRLLAFLELTQTHDKMYL